MYVYKITNKINNKIYIGITKYEISKRFKEHWYIANRKIEKSNHLHSAMLKYGIDNFSVEEIESCDNYENLKKREMYWIKYYNSNNSDIGYNLTEGGDGFTGYVWTEEAIKNMSKAKIGQHHTIKTRKKMSESHKGKPNYNVLNRIHINRDGIHKMIKKEDLQTYISNGWNLGRGCNTGEKNKGKKYIYKNNKIKFVSCDKLREYIDKGWKLGNPTISKRNKKWGCNTKGRFRMIKDNVVKFVKFDDVEEYLKNDYVYSNYTRNKFENMKMSLYGPKGEPDNV